MNSSPSLTRAVVLNYPSTQLPIHPSTHPLTPPPLPLPPTPDAAALPKPSTLIKLAIEKLSSLHANITMISVILSLGLAFKGMMFLYGDRYFMDNIPLSQASSSLDQLIETTATTHQPVLIMGNHNAVLVSEQDWNAIQETLYLLSIPGMRESIHEGMNTPVEDCDQELSW